MATLSPEQARILLEAAAGARLEALYVLAINTGMRQGELLALRWTDVDLNAGALHVRATLQRTREGFVFTEPKTTSSRRQVALTRAAVEALRSHHTRQAEERLHVGAAWEDDDLVFANEVGQPLDATAVLRRSFYPLLERSNLPRIRFHDLRHTAATLLLGQGVHPKIVSEMLGHSQIAITLDLYSHVTPTMQRQAVEALEIALGG
jgi:integrase